MATGIDVSYAQGRPEWDILKATGKVDFVYVKASGGLAAKGPDTSFLHNWQHLTELGMRKGAYHFFVAGLDPVKQADAFFNVVGHLSDSDLPPMIDVEVQRPSTQSPADFTKDIRAFIERAEALFGRKLVVYTGGPIFDSTTTGANVEDLDFIASHDLWLSAYVNDPTKFVPRAWASRGKTWTIWQRSGDIAAGGKPGARFAGIHNVVDVNVTQGAADDLDAWTAASIIDKPIESSVIVPPPQSPEYSKNDDVVTTIPALPVIDEADCEPEDEEPGTAKKLFDYVAGMFRSSK